MSYKFAEFNQYHITLSPMEGNKRSFFPKGVHFRIFEVLLFSHSVLKARRCLVYFDDGWWMVGHKKVLDLLLKIIVK